MTAKRAAEWIAHNRRDARNAYNAEHFIKQADRVAKKAEAIGMSLEPNQTERVR